VSRVVMLGLCSCLNALPANHSINYNYD